MSVGKEQQAEKSIEALLEEQRLFEPFEEFRRNANVSDESIYEEASEDREGFWAKQAERLDWFEKWDKVLDWSNPPFAKWFVGGKLNVSYNCVDRHVKTWRRNKAAIIWEGEPGDERVLTYKDLHREVNKFANVLKGLGIKKGDRVTVYMPMIPELVIALLACTRIGAPHSVVFGGYSADSIRQRVEDAESNLVITADGGYRRGNLLPLKNNVDKALEGNTLVEKVIVYQRGENPEKVHMEPGRDLWWHELMEDAEVYCEPEPMDSEDMLFLLYTSGTTGKPKGVVHTTGGYLTSVTSTAHMIFDLKEEDVYWCTADIGWITGHSYMVYGPLSNGASVVMYEGGPDYPEKDRFWEIIEKYGVTIFYTAPTAIRAFMRWGTEWTEKHDLSSLRLLGTVGEPINPEAWMWYHKYIGNERCPIVDTWWQTETGSILISPLPGVVSTKPGSITRAFPGIEADVLDEHGNSVEPGQGGFLVIKSPWPSMLRTVYNDDQRFIDTYWSNYENTYFTEDTARKDEDGYIWILGRTDDVINVSGHRIGTMEVESAFVDHPKVAEAAVIGRSHDIKGQCIVAFITVKEGVEATPELNDELRQHVATKIGPIARPEKVYFSSDLPKTRSGKIMRRLLGDIAEGRVVGDTTTLADPSVIEQLVKQQQSG
ncbi:MAG: acetate--CoA ligase [Clostridia bacterium]|nr:acetate--CoA ligase [Clostridia bacterium]